MAFIREGHLSGRGVQKQILTFKREHLLQRGRLLDPPTGNPGAFDLTKKHVREAGICPHKLSRGSGFHKGWEVARIQHTGLIPTQNRIFSINTEYEAEFAFRFKNREVCITVLQSIYRMALIIL